MLVVMQKEGVGGRFKLGLKTGQRIQMMAKNKRKDGSKKPRGSLLACVDPVEPVGDRSAWDESELSMADLRRKTWDEIVQLFEGDEASARDWMTRTRIPLGHASPGEMLDSPQGIARLRQFIQQIQRGIVP
jgi:hypothetical protein